MKYLYQYIIVFIIIITNDCLAQSMLKDICPGSFSSGPQGYTYLNGNLYFIANDSIHGYELWRTDGTPIGTILVKDIRPGAAHSCLSQVSFGNNFVPKIIAMGNNVYFFASDSTNQWGERFHFDLWKSDGTESGTHKVFAFSSVSTSPIIDFITDGTHLYFVNSLGNYQRGLWVSDGTTNGTTMLYHLQGASQFTLMDSLIYFVGNDSVSGNELWRTDGTIIGTHRIKDVYPGYNGGCSNICLVKNHEIYFSGIDAPNSKGLWKSDGTTAGTLKVKASYSISASSFFSLNDSAFLFFHADSGSGWHLWRSDGTTSGTYSIYDSINLNISSYSNGYGTGVFEHIGFNGKGYFVSQAQVGTSSVLYETDGTTNGTRLFNPGPYNLQIYSPAHFTIINNHLLFSATKYANILRPWVSDGTLPCTHPVNDNLPTPPFYNPINAILRTDGFYQLGNKVIFTQGDTLHGTEVWSMNVSDVSPCELTPTLYPYITLTSGSVNAGQQIIINGFNFSYSKSASLIINGPSNFQTNLSVPTSATGTLTYSFSTNMNMPTGQYLIAAVDSVTGIYAPIKSFVLNGNLNYYTKLVVLSPEANDTLFTNDTSQITWTDKLILGTGYTVNGAQRNYKYTVEYSVNNGGSWQTLTSIQGWDYINSIKTFHVPVSFSSGGNNCLVRVTDFYKNSNTDSSGFFKTIAPTVTSANIKAELYWDFSYANQNNALYGVAADGAARIYLVVSKINSGIGTSISNVSVQINDAWNNSTATLGKVMAATQVSTYDNEANAANSLTATQNTEAFSRFWFWYVAPDNFVGSNPNNANSAYRYVSASFVINYSNGTSETFDKKIKIVRPPLCLVHGLASDPSTWDNFRHDAFGYDIEFLSDSRFYTKRAIQLDAKASFNVNAQYLTIGFSNQNSLIFQNSLQGVIKDLRNQGYAANRCDYIGHSMGGSVLRYALDHYSNHFYRTGSASNLDCKNYGRGYVNKTITINTPHNSSPWADILHRYTPDLTVGMRIALGLNYGAFPNSLPFSFLQMDNMNSLIPTFTVVDAVRDLQIDQNQGGVNFGTTNLKTHLIGSDFFPGVQNTSNNMIPQGIINIVDQAAEEVDFLNKFLDLTIAEEQDQQLVSDLVEITSDYSNPVQTALEYMERMADLYNTTMFIPESDLVVGVSSQLADYPRTSPNVTVFDNYIGHAFIRPALGNVDAGNRVNNLLNAAISSNQFNTITATSNKTERPSLDELLGERSNTVIVSRRDTSILKILTPTSSTLLKTDSILGIKIRLTDTTNLVSYKVSFQNKTYKLLKSAGTTYLNTQVNSNLLDNNYIFTEAFFKHPDTSFFFFDSVLVNVTTASPLMEFSAKQKVIYLNINQTKTPDYVSYYSGFATSVSNFSQLITANVSNTAIVSFNPFRKSFTGITTGETSAIVSYKGLNDTIYFVVGENPLDSLTIDTNTTNIPELASNNSSLKLLCYPNPFNQKINVDFETVVAGEVSVKIFDIMGTELMAIIDEKREKGLYQTSIDGSKLSNGIYFCELRNGNQKKTTRIVSIKQ